MKGKDILELLLNFGSHTGLQVKLLLKEKESENFDVVKYHYGFDQSLIEFILKRIPSNVDGVEELAGLTFDKIEIDPY